ncbi:hypothetical protein DRJ48_02955 [Candidatus Woesearchaeota archaeon]|nr:MAG: hypothetical protein DRJ48_02955 [Candidatus Woesearchaeota archaeon]
MKFSSFELHELIKAWFVISVAFAIAMSGISVANFYLVLSPLFLIPVLFAGLTVGIAFLFHELAHKFVAQSYGCFAEFRANNQMLFMALIMSLFGFIFVAPGGVLIHGSVKRDEFGKISSAGIIANLILGSFFILGLHLIHIAVIQQLLYYGAYINVWLALFNLIPFLPFDGAKLLHWSKKAYGVLVVVCLVLLFYLTGFLGI